MSWARPPGAPQLPASPLEALEPKENDYKPLLYDYGIPLGFIILGIGGPAANNRFNRRPFFTGIWKHIIGGISLGYLGLLAKNLRDDIVNDHDAVLRQYVALHPEDFPPYQRVLIKNTIESWEPTR